MPEDPERIEQAMGAVSSSVLGHREQTSGHHKRRENRRWPSLSMKVMGVLPELRLNQQAALRSTTLVAMMQTANLRNRDHVSHVGSLHCPRRRGIFAQRQIS
jgi:hypothetical protein